jgi:hypothetical protein
MTRQCIIPRIDTIDRELITPSGLRPGTRITSRAFFWAGSCAVGLNPEITPGCMIMVEIQTIRL